jgi:hypothetical protein
MDEIHPGFACKNEKKNKNRDKCVEEYRRRTTEMIKIETHKKIIGLQVERGSKKRPV